MRAACLQNALERLTAAIRDVETELAAMKAEHDPLASHIFVSCRHYRSCNDTKSGKRRETNAQLSFNTACEPPGHFDRFARTRARARGTAVVPESLTRFQLLAHLHPNQGRCPRGDTETVRLFPRLGVRHPGEQSQLPQA